MDELDRFMREQYEQPPSLPPVTPPAGGWQMLAQRLQDGQPRPAFTLRRKRGWWWSACIIGLLLVGYIGYASTGSTELGAAFPVSVSLPDRSLPIARVGSTTKLLELNEQQLESTVASPAGTPSEAVASPGEADMNMSTEVTTPATIGAATPVLTEPTVVGLDSFGALTEATRVAATPSSYTLQDLLPTTQSLVRSTEYDATSWVMDEVAPNLHTTGYDWSLRNRKWTFEEVPRKEQPPGAWELTVLALPWVVRSDDRYFQVTSDTTGGNIYPEGTYTLNSGQPLTVFYDESRLGSESLSKRRLELVLTCVEFARRTPSGFRFSAGAIVGWGQRKLYDYNLENLGSGFGSEDYALVYRSQDGSALYLTTGVQYTINRRKRFRIIAGINALTSVYQTYRDEVQLVGGVPYEEHFVRRVTSRDTDFLNFILPTPQFTFQYQVSQHLSLTAGLGAMFGVGATYGW